MADVHDELRAWITEFATGEHDIADLLCDRHAEATVAHTRPAPTA